VVRERLRSPAPKAAENWPTRSIQSMGMVDIMPQQGGATLSGNFSQGDSPCRKILQHRIVALR
jgi:hypothetical protein